MCVEAHRLEEFDGLKDGGMFDGAEDDVFSATLIGPRAAFDGEVDGFGSAGGEDDFVRGGGVEELGDFFAGFVQCGAGFDTAGVNGAGSAEAFGKPREHCFENGRLERSSGEVIKTNAPHFESLTERGLCVSN